MRTLPLFLVVLLLSGCVTPTKAIKPLSEADKGVRNIQSVSVSYNDLNKEALVSADQKLYTKAQEKGANGEIKYKSLKSALQSIAQERLEERDNSGSLYANVSIEIDNLKLANAAAAILVGDSDQLAGTVKVYDPKTKELLTEFYVDIIEGAGGLLGLAIRGAGVRERLSLQFADHIGNELGFPEVEKTVTKSTGTNN